MISRILMKENLGFKEANLELSGGLTVFSGLSGAGKSVLFSGILAAFALCESEAKFVELELDDKIDLESFGIEAEEENVFKMLKEKSTKYFINNQSIAKKSLQNLSKTFVKYLSVKDSNEFSNEKFLELLDALECAKNPKFKQEKENFIQTFKDYNEAFLKLSEILDEEKRVEELKEVALAQIEKISSINPKPGEYEQLLKLKKRLSKQDKIEEAWAKANGIFEYEKTVLDALNLSEVDTNFFSECFNELRIVAQSQNFDEFDFDIEELLDRISDLSYLIKRYESIEGALETLDLKKKELSHYENLSFEKKELELLNRNLKEKLEKEAQILSKARVRNLSTLEDFLNNYLAKLYMGNLKLECVKNEKMSSLGQDEIKLSVSETKLKNLSSGELNRLRLAFIATESKILNAGQGIIFLDEIDANLSGKEAMSIAKVLDELSRFYQIFAISHLPQLSSKAHNHFLVEKNGTQSRVKKLEKEERVKELARMVSGEKISDEALKFAKTLFELS